MEKTIKLNYVFDSDYIEEKLYEDYDGEDFVYEVDTEEIKEFVSRLYMNILSRDSENEMIIKDFIDELEYEDLINWKDVIKSFDHEIKLNYMNEAMHDFIDKHKIYTDDELDEIEFELMEGK